MQHPLSFSIPAFRRYSDTRLTNSPTIHDQLDVRAGTRSSHRSGPCRRSICERSTGGRQAISRCAWLARTRNSGLPTRARQAHLKTQISATLEFEIELARLVLLRFTCQQMCKADISHPRARASTPTHEGSRDALRGNHARDRTSKPTSAPAAVAKTLDAEVNAPEGLEARPGSLSTSTTALPCHLGRRKSGRGERNDRDGLSTCRQVC